jgi:hypothetical protein
MMLIREYFFRIRILGCVDIGSGRIITDPDGSGFGSYQDIFVATRY